MTAALQQQLLERLTSAAAFHGLPLAPHQLQALAADLTPAVTQLVEAGPVQDQADVEVSEFAGCTIRTRIDVSYDAPASLLAQELRSQQHDVVEVDVLAADQLTLRVRPGSAAAWQWWLDHLTVATGTLRSSGQSVTGSGHYGEITVRLIGVGAAVHEARLALSSRRLQRMFDGLRG